MSLKQGEWANDATTNHCIGCRARFTFVSRRHHCRSCGEIFCEACSSNTSVIPGDSFADPNKGGSHKRVCKHCHEIIKKSQQLSDALGPRLKNVANDKSAKNRVTEELQVFAHRMLTVSDLPSSIKNHVYVTNSGNMQRLIDTLKVRLQRISDSTGCENRDGAEAPSNSSPPGSPPASPGQGGAKPRFDFSLGATAGPGAAVLYEKSLEHEQVSLQLDAVCKHALDITHVLQRNSLTAFFHTVHAGLTQILLRCKILSLCGVNAPEQVEALAREAGSNRALVPIVPMMTINEEDIDCTIFAVSEYFMRLVMTNILWLDGVAAPPTPLRVATEAITLIERQALNLTRRYEEAIVCLEESGAVTLAETVLRRIANSFCERKEPITVASGLPLFDLLCSAIQSSSTPPRSLKTRVADVETSWTDEGVLDRSGILTADGVCYEFATHVEAKKYFYRRGTAAEAEGLGMVCTGGNRASTSPIWSVQSQVQELQALVLRRSNLFARYASCHFEVPSFSHWAAKSGGLSAIPGVNAKGTVEDPNDDTAPGHHLIHVPMVSNMYDDDNQQLHPVATAVTNPIERALHTVWDYVADPPIFQKLLLARYTDAAVQLELLTTKINQLSLRVADVATGTHVTDEARGYLERAQSLGKNADPGLRQKQMLFDRFRRILMPRNTSTLDFYMLLRLKLLSVFLASETVLGKVDVERPLLAGVGVPKCQRLDAVVGEIIRSARFNPATQSWAPSDVIDRHCDLMARALTERYAGAVINLAESGLHLFADLTAVRLYHVISESTPAELDTVARVQVVQLIESVDLGSTFVHWKKVYLPANNGTHTLCEHSIHTKAGLITPTGERFIGDENGSRDVPSMSLSVLRTAESQAAFRDPQSAQNSTATIQPSSQRFAAAVSPGVRFRRHHRPHKYGYVMAWSAQEPVAKRLLPADENWNVVANAMDDKPNKPKRSLSTLFRAKPTPKSTVPMIKGKKDTKGLHWGSSMISAGPRMVVAGDSVGVTAQPRNREGGFLQISPKDVNFVVLSQAASRDMIDPISVEDRAAGIIAQQPATDSEVLTPAENAAENVVDGTADSGPVSFPSSTPQPVVHAASKPTMAGIFIIGVEHKDFLLVANVIKVEPSVVDWGHKGSMVVFPHRASAGATMNVIMTLRDRFGNLTSATHTDDFAITVVNEMEIVPAPVKALQNGSFAFSFIPIVEAGIDLVVTVGGSSQRYPYPLQCASAKVDFKNTLLSFDEVEVEAGNTVNGNILLQDMFGNRACCEDIEAPRAELINGGREMIDVEKVHDGEYIFSFVPKRQGTAMVRLTAGANTSVAIIGKLTVHSPQKVDWARSSTISCTSKLVFAGEPLSFHIIPRDKFGNAVAEGVSPSDFMCLLRYTDNPDEVIDIDSVIKHTDRATGVIFAFTATPTRSGELVAEVSYQGTMRTSGTVTIPPSTLCWEASKVIVPETATVGEWITVQINSCDRFQNPAPAHAEDFSVSVLNTAEDGVKSNQQEAKTKKVAGANCTFGFQFLATRATKAVVAVTYVGHTTHTSYVKMVPAAVDWSCTTMHAGEGRDEAIHAGDVASCILEYRDTFGNSRMPPPESDLVVMVGNGERKEEVTETERIKVSEGVEHVRYIAHPTMAGDVYFTAALRSNATDTKTTPPSSVIAGETDWDSCIFTSSAPGLVIAGLPVTATLQLFDRFKNPSIVENIDQYVEFVVFNRPAEAGSPGQKKEGSDDMPSDTTIPFGSVTRPTRSTLSIQVVPERAGEVEFIASRVTRIATPDIDPFAGYDAYAHRFSDIQFHPSRAGMKEDDLPDEDTEKMRAYQEADEKTRAAIREQNEALAGLVFEKKTIINPVRNSEVDWNGRTVVSVADEVISGHTIKVTILLRDTFDNPVRDLRPSQFRALVTYTTDNTNAPSEAKQEVPELYAITDDAEANVITDDDGKMKTDLIGLKFHPRFAGQALLKLDLQGIDRPEIPVAVLPARADLRKTKLKWQTPTSTAGVETRCNIMFRDRFLNYTADGHPPLADITATSRLWCGHDDEEGTPVEVAVIAEAVAPHIPYQVVTSSEKRGTLEMEVNMPDSSGEEPEPVLRQTQAQSMMVEPSVQLWENSTFELDGKDATLAAGSMVTGVLNLRDVYGNLAYGINDVNTDVVAKLVPVPNAETGEAPRGAKTITATVETYDPSVEPDQSSSFAIHVSPTAAAKYRLIVGLKEMEESEFKSIDVAFTPAPVSWPEHCTFSPDAPVVSAGNPLFFQIETHDVYGNPTNDSVDLTSMKVRLLLRPRDGDVIELDTSAVQLMALPQQPCGLFGFTFVPEKAGTIVASVIYTKNSIEGKRVSFVSAEENDALQLKATEDIVVAPSQPDWSKSALITIDEVATVGQTTTMYIVVCDSFSNPIDPDDGNVVEELQLATLTCINTKGAEEPVNMLHTLNSQLASRRDALQAAAFYEVMPTLLGDISVVAKHRDDPTEHKLSLDVFSRGIDSAEANIVAVPKNVCAGWTLAIQIVLRDQYGNLVPGVNADQVGATAFSMESKELYPCKVVGIPPTDEHADSSFAITTSPTRAGTVQITVMVAEEGKDGGSPSRRIGKIDVPVLPSGPAPSKCYINTMSTQLPAGKPCEFELHLYDTFGNAVQEFIAGTISCSNGTAQPAVEIPDGQDYTKGVVKFSCKAMEVGKLVAQYTNTINDEVETTRSEVVDITPAEIEWSMCTMKIIDESIPLGEETSAVIVPKDKHGNIVPAKERDFTIKVINGKTEIPHDGITHTGKNLMVHFKPKERGPVVVEVIYRDDSDNARRTKASRVE